ncbi:hypothetical protein Acy02nite_26980 [Actinoplanes cyaneus]|uniref:Uncharacterized protein n=1 Tax=Actinoplanes cyaneus TaxID=52696 RepID=A0A919II68_9ACTN|nr:hypothetical protein Acy02nite_26980 [Actinoplanes cyaneus]
MAAGPADQGRDTHQDHDEHSDEDHDGRAEMFAPPGPARLEQHIRHLDATTAQQRFSQTPVNRPNVRTAAGETISSSVKGVKGGMGYGPYG